MPYRPFLLGVRGIIYSVRFDAAEGARGVGSSSIGSICEADGFGVSIKSIAGTLSPGFVKSSGGVKLARVKGTFVLVEQLIGTELERELVAPFALGERCGVNSRCPGELRQTH